MVQHTILLMQPAAPSTRTYYDFADINLCMKFLVEMYEKKLKQLNPTLRRITYDVNDVYEFMDTYKDMCCLTQHQDAYLPRDIGWMKQKLFNFLKKQAYR